MAGPTGRTPAGLVLAFLGVAPGRGKASSRSPAGQGRQCRHGRRSWRGLPLRSCSRWLHGSFRRGWTLIGRLLRLPRNRFGSAWFRNGDRMIAGRGFAAAGCPGAGSCRPIVRFGVWRCRGWGGLVEKGGNGIRTGKRFHFPMRYRVVLLVAGIDGLRAIFPRLPGPVRRPVCLFGRNRGRLVIRGRYPAVRRCQLVRQRVEHGQAAAAARLAVAHLQLFGGHPESGLAGRAACDRGCLCSGVCRCHRRTPVRHTHPSSAANLRMSNHWS